MAILQFNASEVRKLVAHARSCNQHAPLFGHMRDPQYWIGATAEDKKRGYVSSDKIDTTKIPPHLVLVHDSGVYLMSSSLPKLEGSENACFVAYANGLGEDAPISEVRDAVGGDDFSEDIDLNAVEKVLSMISSDQTVDIRITPRTIALLAPQ